MCANYVPVTMKERLAEWFAATAMSPEDGEAAARPPAWAAEAWPGSPAPFVRRDPQRSVHARELATGRFGLIPGWSRDAAIGRKTYNARSETVAEKPSFRDAWRAGRRCVVPVEAFYEPCWEGGRAVRWRIARQDGAPLGLAGLWGAWRAPDGEWTLSFTLLTINADGHPLMQRFHRPEDEKRMVVVLDEAEYDAWLDAPPARVPGFLRRFDAARLTAAPAPLPPRGKAAAAG